MRRKAFDSTLSKRAVCDEPPHTWHGVAREERKNVGHRGRCNG